MRNIKSKKGYVDVISIVLLSLIAIMAIALIYPEVKQIIESSVNPPKSCEEITNEHSISMIASCYNQLTNNIEVNITKTNKEPLKSLVFKLDFNNETKYWECNSGCGNCKILDQGNKTYYLFPNRAPKTITIMGNGCNLVTREINPCQQ